MQSCFHKIFFIFITNLPQYRGGTEVRTVSRAEARRKLLDGTASASEGAADPPTPNRSEPAVASKGRAGFPRLFDLKHGNSILVKRESIVDGHRKFQQPKSPTLSDPISATPVESPLFLHASSLASSQSPAPSKTPETLAIGPRSPSIPISSRFRAVPSSQNRTGGDWNMRKRGPDDIDDISPRVKKEKMLGPFAMD